MEERKTFFDYLGQVFTIFGFSILALIVICTLVGEATKGYSTMFALGAEGLTIATMLQFLLEAVIITALRFVFFTDTLIKKMSLAVRTCCMFGLVLLFIIISSMLFGWFPVNEWAAWVSFFVSFGLCTFIATRVTMWKQKMEDRKLEEALQKAKSGL